MKVTTERLENCQVKVIVEMDAADIDKKVRQTARKLSRTYNVPGYRRGKAPYHAVVRVFGREAVQQQALEDFGQDLYEEALEEIDYEPYEIGELEDVEWDPFRMTVLLPIKPEVELGDYRAVRVPFGPDPVTDEDVARRLEELQDQNTQWVPVERPAAMGDQIVLDMEGRAGDTLIMSNEGHEMVLGVEPAHPLPGFHDEIVGMSAGEEKTFLLTMPEEDYEEDVAGQEAEIKIHLHTVREEDRPPLDDELAMMVGDYDSVDDLKASIREEMETQALHVAESGYLDKVLDAMIEAAAKVEYPTQAVDREADLVLGQMERNLAASGMQLDTYLGLVGKTRESYRQELRPSAEERLRKRLVLREVARLEGIEADPDEVDAEIDRLREVMGSEAEQMQEMFDSPEWHQSVAEDLVMAQAQERVTLIGKGEAPPLEVEEEAETPDEGVVSQAIEEAVEEETDQEAAAEASATAKAPEEAEEPEADEEAVEEAEAEAPENTEELEADEQAAEEAAL
jgi:trigger factor